MLLGEPARDLRGLQVAREDAADIDATDGEVCIGDHVIEAEQRGHGFVAQDAVIFVALERAVRAVSERHFQDVGR